MPFINIIYSSNIKNVDIIHYQSISKSISDILSKPESAIYITFQKMENMMCGKLYIYNFNYNKNE